MNPLNVIAVITPVFNGEKFILDCVNNVKKQTNENCIHYLYDDGSTDNSKNILLNFKNDPTIRVFIAEKNQGQSHARNLLIENAIKDGCQYLAFLDVDDIWNINHLETSLETIKDFDIVYSLPNFVVENMGNGTPYGITIPNMFIGKQLLHNNFIWISSVVAKIQAFKDVQFDSSLNNIEDYEMWIRQYKLGRKFICKPDKTVTYYVHQNGHAGKSQGKYEILNQKHKRLSSIKLHLACGKDYLEDYINVDLYDDTKVDAKFDVAKLPYDDNCVDEIKAFHIIEHFDFFEGQKVLAEWCRVLKPGGRLWLETPDFQASCETFVNNPEMRNSLYGHFFATPWIEGQTHKFLFTEDQLKTQLGWAGFTKMQRLSPTSKYAIPGSEHLFLNIEAFK